MITRVHEHALPVAAQGYTNMTSIVWVESETCGRIPATSHVPAVHKSPDLAFSNSAGAHLSAYAHLHPHTVAHMHNPHLPVPPWRMPQNNEAGRIRAPALHAPGGAGSWCRSCTHAWRPGAWWRLQTPQTGA